MAISGGNTTSIVGKYLSTEEGPSSGKSHHKKRKAPLPSNHSDLNVANRESRTGEVAVGRLVSFSPEPAPVEEEEPPWRRLLLEAERRTRELMAREREEEEAARRMLADRDNAQQSLGAAAMAATESAWQRSRLAAEQQHRASSPPPSGGAGCDEREKLREMLSGLRRDPFDEELESNDGKFFPCEFCGDPYPVEFIMRHQVINQAYRFDFAAC